MEPENNDAAKDRKPVTDYFEKVWSQALTAYSAAEDEVGRVVQRVAQSAGWSQEEVVRQARELTERLASQRKDLERSLEDGVRRALARMRIPRRDQLQQLEARLDALAKRVEALSERR